MGRMVDMTKGDAVKRVLQLAFPLMLANAGQQLSMIVDAAIVARGAGVKALAAVGATDWSYWMALWAATWLAHGFGVFVSRYFGEQDWRGMNRAIAASALLCGAAGCALSIAGLLGARALLAFLGTPADILDGAAVYLTVMAAGMPAVTAHHMAAALLRAFGDGRTPLQAMLVAGALHIAMDLAFVLGFHWGVAGAACANVAAQLAAFAYCFWKLRKSAFVRLQKGDWRPSKGLCKEMLAFGLPLALQYIAIAASGMAMQSAVNAQGSVFIAGYTASNKLYGLLESTGVALGFAFSTFFAQNYGAGQKARVRKGVSDGLKVSACLAACVAGAMLLAGKGALRALVGADGGAAALEVGWRYLAAMSVPLAALYWIHVYRSALQALGASAWSMASGFAECAVRVLAAKGGAAWIGGGILFYIEPLAWLGALLAAAASYYARRGKLLA